MYGETTKNQSLTINWELIRNRKFHINNRELLLEQEIKSDVYIILYYIVDGELTREWYSSCGNFTKRTELSKSERLSYTLCKLMLRVKCILLWFRVSPNRWRDSHVSVIHRLRSFIRLSSWVQVLVVQHSERNGRYTIGEVSINRWLTTTKRKSFVRSGLVPF